MHAFHMYQRIIDLGMNPEQLQRAAEVAIATYARRSA